MVLQHRSVWWGHKKTKIVHFIKKLTYRKRCFIRMKNIFVQSLKAASDSLFPTVSSSFNLSLSLPLSPCHFFNISTCLLFSHASTSLSLSLSLYIYIYISICKCIHMHIYITKGHSKSSKPHPE